MTPHGLPYWESHARLYAWSLRIFGRPMPRAAELALRAIPREACVLEVGCGTGELTEALARRAGQLIATDYSGSMVKLAQKRVRASGSNHVMVQRADVYALGFAPHSFDAVVASNVLHVLADVGSALASIRSVLKPGGKLIVPTFCHAEGLLARVVASLLARTGFPGRHRFTASSLRELLERHRVCVETCETIPGVLPIAYIDGRFAA